MNTAAIPAMTGAVAVTLHAAIPDSRRSIAEITGALIAELAAPHIIEDADSVTDSTARWDKTVPAGMVRLAIRQTRSPEERIGADTRRKVSDHVKERFAEARP